MLNLRKQALLIFLILSVHAAQYLRAQNDARYDIDGIISLLEELHPVKIFYEPKWFEGKTFNRSVADMPLDRALNAVISGMDLTIVRVYDYIVILPREVSAVSFRESDTLMLTIGDPAEFGRYNRVIFNGRILDGTTGESLPGAVIYSETTGTGSSTGTDGTFSVTLPVGELLLRLSYVGYEDQVRRVNLFGPGEYDFFLFEETQRIDEVTIMARRAEENVSRTQMSVITMDARLLRELPGNLGEQDLIRSVTLLPGVQSVGEFGAGFHVRGGSNDQNLLMLENAPLFNSSHLFGLISVVNPDMVSEMNLYKGSIPARFGERVSSVMDIRMQPGNVEELKLSGGIGLINSRLHLEAPIVRDKVTLSVGGRSSYSNWLLGRLPDEELANSSAGFYDISSVLNISPSQNNNISVFAYHSSDDFSYAGNTEYDYSNTLASVRWNSVPGEKMSFSVTGGLSMYNYNVRDGEQTDPYEAYLLSSSIDYQSLRGSLLWFPDGNHRVETGINVIRYDIAPGSLSPLGDKSLTGKSVVDREQGLELAIFLSDEFEITDRLSTEIGLRYSGYLHLGPQTTYIYEEGSPRRIEYITDTLTIGRNRKAAGYGRPEPRLSLRYSIDGSSSLKASYTRNNQYINLISNTSVMTPADTWKLSDIHLSPLTSDNIAAGYFRNFMNNMIETSVEVYYRNLRNVIEYKDGARILMNHSIETDLINAEGYNYGIEFYAGKNAGRLTGWLSYTFSASMRRTTGSFPEEQINRNAWFSSDFDKPHEFILNANYNVSRRWRIGGTFNASTGRPVTLPELRFPHGERWLIYYSDRNKYRLPSYHRLDLYIARNESLKLHRRRKGNWTLSLLNVYGRRNPYSVFYERDLAGPGSRRGNFNLYTLYIIGRPMPVLTYNFRF